MISKKVFRGEYRWAAMILSALLLVVVGAAIYGSAYYYAMQNRCYDCTRVMVMVPVVKSNQPLRAGQRLYPEMVTVEEVPERFLPPNPILGSDVNAYEGLTLTVDLETDQMILESDFAPIERHHHDFE